MRIVLALIAAVSVGHIALAQPAGPKSKPPAAKSTATASTTSSSRKPRTPQSIACSKQADAKGLHKAERKTFMSSCKKAAA